MFFEAFKLWLPTIKTCKSRLNYLQTHGEREFNGTVFQNFCQEQEIKIEYAILYMYEKNGIAK